VKTFAGGFQVRFMSSAKPLLCGASPMKHLTSFGADGARARNGARRSFLAAVFVAVASHAASAQTAITLEQALAEAAARNARLPFSAMDVAAAERQAPAARGAPLPRLSVQGAFQISPPTFAYAPPGAPPPAGQ